MSAIRLEVAGLQSAKKQFLHVQRCLQKKLWKTRAINLVITYEVVRPTFYNDNPVSFDKGEFIFLVQDFL